MATPKKGIAYDFSVALSDTDSNRKFKGSPTIETGDFKISIDDLDDVDLTNLPLVVNLNNPKKVKISLTAAEMSGTKVTVTGSDPDEEWDDIFIELDIPTINEDDLSRMLQLHQGFLHTYQIRVQFIRTTDNIFAEDEAEAISIMIDDTEDLQNNDGEIDYIEVLECEVIGADANFDKFECSAQVRWNAFIIAVDEFDALEFTKNELVNFGTIKRDEIQHQQIVLVQTKTGVAQ